MSSPQLLQLVLRNVVVLTGQHPDYRALEEPRPNIGAVTQEGDLRYRR